MAMISKTKITEHGKSLSLELGKILVEQIRSDETLKEQFSEAFNFKEDNTMDNSGALYTTVLAKAIYYKSYDQFAQYFDLVWNLTPADIGMPAGSGAYKIPKVLATTAVKLASGEAVEYVNDNKTSLILETDTFGVGTRIDRRLRLRGAPGFVDKLITSASDAVLRAVCTDLINGLVNGADADNTVATGITYEAIETAKYNIKNSADANGVLFGFVPDMIAFSNIGWKTLAISTDFKALVQYGQRNVPGSKVENEYQIFNGLRTVDTGLISVTKNSKAVHALVLDSKNFGVFLKETEMDVFDGRIPGTAGDTEIIHAMDAGMAVLNAEAGAVITAA